MAGSERWVSWIPGLDSRAKILLDFKADQAGKSLGKVLDRHERGHSAQTQARAEATAALAAVQPLIMEWPVESLGKGAAQPLVITAAEIDELLGKFGKALDAALPRLKGAMVA